VLGFTLLLPEESDDSAISVPERSIDLVLAGTRATERGRGIGSALAARALDSAAKEGFAACIADWRTANLLASRFWPRLGFHPVAYRLERRIDGRVLWANGAS
jgi:ribosomal protein S18 acetylase RimI-like enzyme